MQAIFKSIRTFVCIRILVACFFGLSLFAWPWAGLQAAAFDFGDLVRHIERAHEVVIDRSIDEAQDWMREQSDPQLQALATIPKTMLGAEDNIDAEQYLFQPMRNILDATPSQAALHFLALACSQRFLMAECIDQGLADAVEAVDPANFATWSIVYQDQPEVLLGKLEQAETFDSFRIEAIRGWYQALDVSTRPIGDFVKQVMPWMIVNANAMPAFQPLTESCKIAVETATDSNLSVACRRVSRFMRDQGGTVINRKIGYTVLAEMAKIEQSDQAEQLQREREAFNERVQCLNLANVALEFDSALQKTYTAWLLQYGEIKAMEKLADQQGIECD